MKLSCLVPFPRRFLNSPYDVSKPLPKVPKWAKRERIFRFSAWQYGSMRDAFKCASTRAQKIWMWETEKRKDAPKLEKYYSRERVSAALAEHKMESKHFYSLLRKAKIELGDEILAHLAIWEPRSFKSLAMLTKQLALEEDRQGIVTTPAPENVITRGQLSDGPLPRNREYIKGPAQSFKTPPRPLRRDEY